MTLNRNPDNSSPRPSRSPSPGNVVPGIDFTNDPLLQGRLFSYLDTQLTRLGGPNFHEIPINRPVAPVHNNQRDGIHEADCQPWKGQTTTPNSLAAGFPAARTRSTGSRSYQEKMEGRKVRERSEKLQGLFQPGKALLEQHVRL